MLKPLITSIIFLSLGFSASKAQNIVDNHITSFNKGLELYDKGMYSTAGETLNNLYFSNKPYNVSEIINHNTAELLKYNARYLALLSNLQLGNIQAEKKLQNFIYINPISQFSKKAFFDIGNIYFQNGSYNEAKKWYLTYRNDKLTTLQKEDYNFNLAYSYFIKKDYDSALPNFIKITNKAGHNYNLAQYYIGYINYFKANYDTALKHLLRVQDDGISTKNLLTLIGQIYLYKKDYASIYKLYDIKIQSEKATEIPNEFMSILASSYFASGAYENALTYYNIYLEKKPKLTSQELYQIGYSYYKTNKYDKATSILQQLITYNDIYAQYGLLSLGNMALIRNDKQDALASFRKAASLNFSKKIAEESLFQLSKLAYESNYNQEALNSIRKFISKYPKSDKISEAKSLLSAMLLDSNNCKEAIELLDDLTIKDAQVASLYQKVSYCYAIETFNNNLPDKAIENFNKSLRYPHDNQIKLLSLFWKAEALYESGMYQEAVANYMIVLQNKNTKHLYIYPQVYYSIAHTFLQLKNYRQAAKYFENYLSLAKSTDKNQIIDSYLNLGNSYFALKIYTKAIENYNKIILEKHTNSDYAMYEKALIFGLENKLPDQIYTLKTLIELYPKSEYVDKALYEMGHSNFILKNYNEAISNFTELKKYKYSPYIPQAQVSLALINMNLGKENEAINIYKQVIRDHPNTNESKQALESIKNIYIKQGNPDLYFSYVKTIPGIHIESKNQELINFEAGRSVFLNKNYNKAISTLTSYIDKYPSGYFLAEALYIRAQSYKHEKNKDKALSDYQALLKTNNNNYNIIATKEAAIILLEKKLYAQAAPLLSDLDNKKESIDDTTHIWALLNLVISYHEAKKPQLAMQYATKLLSRPKLTTDEKDLANLYMAKALLIQNKNDEALTYLKKVSTNKISETQANTQYLIAYIQYLKNNYEESQRICFKIISTFPANSTFTAKTFLLLAENYYKQGNSFQAIATLQSIVDNYSQNDNVLQTAKKRLKEITEESNKTTTNNESKN
ncbi:MAG: tetratricopeptide repeat protein [Solitalea-like symbiont of Tyrophagus putrescentiae]